ncbi:tryptophan--tRNA ligase [Vulgatibacter incomptus]|uniref:Tryptophan--tRNA ligase n=1 Tax=Vulgatibacter incomptus TaxID=1391653 RepID=A0A0K1PDZ3_9BACT|nr:tryptophan--tRNA ligase [Vulgatibacter incomptus]AKU91344.1 Tryptophanyl-tRNA synthetase [Vulgatibacter incomptus]
MSTSAPSQARILSGVQPSGTLHIGNYFGAIQQHIQLQDSQAEAFYFIANYHALTTLRDADRLRELTHNVALDYLALGLDPAKAVFFRQSDVPEVHELAWFLATITPVSLLEKGVSYKDKVTRGIAANAGLLTYPVLMAADILLQQASLVPVGEDQVQHVEFARDMAGFFNNAYAGGQEVLKLPKAHFAPGKKVPGLDGQKMSKSYGNTIGIFEEGSALKKKVMSIKTTSVPLGQPLDPENDTVFAIYKLVASQADVAAMEADYRSGAIGFGHAKQRLHEALDKHFADSRDRRKELEKNPAEVEAILRMGAERARHTARVTIDACRHAVGV